MKNIPFDESEISSLIKFYEQEKQKVQERINSINDILSKLRSDDSAKKTVAPVVKKRKKTAKAPKLDLTTFITDTLKQKNEVFIASDFTDLAVNHFKLALSEEESKLLTANISAALFRMVKMNALKKYPIKDKKRGFWYGLPEWFDENSRLKAPFAAKVG
ncbi:MAG: hypothetical protein HGB19_04660 [Chlorobiales bacterium]|jgi:hypothetical protein|nr:hypothetical protein [Chlorobiales bacterium]